MGKAKRNKQAGAKAGNAGRSYTPADENSRRLYELLGPETLGKVAGEIDRGGFVAARVLYDEASGEFFIYDTEDPVAGDAISGLVMALGRKYRSVRSVPYWLAKSVIEEPPRMAYLGHGMAFNQIVELHRYFPWAGGSPEATWTKVVEMHATGVAECEAAEIAKSVRAPTADRKAVRI